MPFYGLPFFYGDMRKITVTVVLCAILGVNLFFSCQSVVENAKQPDAALITQTKDSVEAGLSKDFCRLSLVFQDVEGKLIKNSLDILMGEEFDSMSRVACVSNGRLDTLVQLSDYIVVVANDTFYLSTQNYGGKDLLEQFMLPCRVVTGRIMEVDGTPIKKMPIHVRISIREKGKGRRWKKMVLPDEPLIFTDSLGYYQMIVPEDVAEVSLRTSGFLVGKFVRKELLEHGAQNFLFEPFKVRNLCSDYLPQYNYYLEDEEGASIDVQDRNTLFASDSLLENLSTITMVATGYEGQIVRKLKKKNKVFRSTEIRICKKEN
jgi:hypothetical protein